MLKEQFIAASRAPPAPPAGNTPQLKNAGIYIHTFQPQPALASTFKKCLSEPQCVASSNDHIFAAQTQKAVVHVYNRARGNQEAIIPFPERIRSLTLCLDDSVLALGTEGGRLILWEAQTGRVLTTPAAHLQAVTCLAGDPSQNFLLSGSPDAIVQVWSLLDLLSFGSYIHPQHDSVQARHTLTEHNAGITALAVGHSLPSTNVAFSASEDKTIVVWNYLEGVRLRTIVLDDIPRCVALDPADRACFVGFDDGSVQCIDFFHPRSMVSALHDQSLTSTPIRPPPSSRWRGPATSTTQGHLNATLSMSLSYDGTALITGHEDGGINKWDVGGRRFTGTVAQYNGAPITNIDFQVPRSLQRKRAWSATAIVKPKPLENFSMLRSAPDDKYCFSAVLDDHPSHQDDRTSAGVFDMSSDFIAQGNEELEDWYSSRGSNAKSMANGHSSNQHDEDYLTLDNGIDQNEEVQRLQQHLADMEESHKRLSIEIMNMRKDSKTLKELEREQLTKRARKEKTRKAKADKEWAAISKGQQAAVGIATEPMDEEIDGGALRNENIEENGDSTSTTSTCAILEP